MKQKINIGTASIILIFIILCLSVFALLGLSDARGAQVFAKRRADSVSAFYQTDALGQAYIGQVAAALKDGSTASEAATQALSILPEGSLSSEGEEGQLICEIPMSAGQALHIELDGNDASVNAYYVYNSVDYAIDNHLPVWTGDES